MDSYPNNRGSNFTNKLPVPLEFPPDTYVSLEEISYINAFYNVVGERNKISVFDFEHEWPPHSPHNSKPYSMWGKFHNVTLRDGHYTSRDGLVDMLNEVISSTGVKQVENKKIFTYDATSLKIHYNMQNIQASIFLRGALLNLLGIKQGAQGSSNEFMVVGRAKDAETFEWTKENGEKEIRHFYHPENQWSSSGNEGNSDYPVNLAPYSSMVIYTDIICSQIVGNMYSDSLRCLAIKAPDSAPPSQVIHEVKNPYYLKLNRRFISGISVVIKDLQDNFIDFLQGETRIKLRFRQKKDI